MEKQEIIDLLKNVPLITDNEKQTSYTLLPFLYDRISTKELLHSEIIASLLDPSTKHACGTLFLGTFLDAIQVNHEDWGKLEDTKVEVERGVDNMRRIDILLTCGDNAIIVENKLNNACDQPNQLKDYLKSMKNEKYTVHKIVYIPQFEIKSATEEVEADIVNLYPKDLIDWLETSKDPSSSLICQNYIDLLNYINKINKNYMEAKSIQKELTADQIKKLIDLSSVVTSQGWTEARLNYIADEVGKKFKDKVTREIKNGSYLQLWVENDYCFWVEVWSYKNEYRLWVVSKNKSVDIDGFSHEGNFDNEYFKNPDKFSYDYPSKAKTEELVSEIVELLNQSK